jgi:hypothetical protein
VPEREYQGVFGGYRLIRHLRPPHASGSHRRPARCRLDGRLRACTLRGKKRELELALQGSFTAEQRWLLQQELRQLDWLELQITALEQEIERRVAPFAEPMQRIQTIQGLTVRPPGPS